MGIESKYMKIDKGPAYLNGITTNTRLSTNLAK